jgi:hypothetical protein
MVMHSKRGPEQRRTMASVAILCSILFSGGAATAAEPGTPPRQETTNPVSAAGEALSTDDRALGAGVPSIRRLDVDSVTGAEPDPESFDRAGLERWWTSYVRKEHPDRTPPVHASAGGER